MLSNLLIIIFVLFIFIYALIKKVDAYNSFLCGSKEGLLMFITIYPTLLAMTFMIQLLKETLILEKISQLLSTFITIIPVEIFPLLLFRPISGSASLSVLTDIFASSGVDSLSAIMASIIQGSTDTTLYVISLYFNYVGVKNCRNALKIGLFADLCGMLMAIILTLIFIKN